IAQMQAAAEKHRNNPRVKIVVPRLDDLPRGAVQFRVRRLGGRAVLLLHLPGGGLQIAEADANASWLLPPHGDPYVLNPAPPTDPLPAPEAAQAAMQAGPALPDRLRRLAEQTTFSLLADFYRSRPLTPTEGVQVFRRSG